MNQSCEIVFDFLKSENERDWTTFESLVHSNIVFEVIGGDKPMRGKNEYIERMKEIYSDLKDWHFTITDFAENKETIFVEFYGAGHFTGKHKGVQYSEAKIQLAAICVFKVHNGLIINIKEFFDYQSFEQQLNKNGPPPSRG